MKLIIAIVHDEDAHELVNKLTDEGYGVTKLATTGGFLRSGNTTLLIGVEVDKLDVVMEIVGDICQTRTGVITPPSPVLGSTGIYVPTPMEVSIGGATMFIMDVDKFVKL